ncbi:MAG: hypothetical protein KDI92_15520 [Xanthomonadales bacterium]|nr:hypothetical protein [Xanthomonadales bacterium]
MKKSIISFMLFGSTQLLAGGAPYLTVGADQACDFSTIQAALDSGASDTIRVASNKNYFETLELVNASKTIVGGYADCTQAGFNITDLSRPIITGNGSDSVLLLQGLNNPDFSVTLRNLVFANGINGVRVESEQGSSVQVVLDNIWTTNNSGTGISVGNFNVGAATVHVKDSQIEFNSGGGIECTGEDLKVRVGGSTTINNNSNSGSGGGLRITNGCDVQIFSPTVIKNNQSSLSGGGLYASNANATVFGLGSFCENAICFGDWDSPVTFEENQASRGAAVYVENANGNLDMVNALLTDNAASALGGALGVANGASAQVFGYTEPNNPCWSPGSCMQINANTANFGGAVYVTGADSSFLLTAGKVSENSANQGVAFGIDGVNSTLTVSDSMLVDNGQQGNGTYDDNNLVYLNNVGIVSGTGLILDRVTIAGNNLTQAVLENNNGGSLDVYSSIILDQQNVYSEIPGNSSSHFECMIAHENSSYSAGGTVTVVNPLVEPVFVNPQGGNYHLHVNSPAIDYCYDASGNSTTDIDYDDRGVDNPDIDNLHGTYDLGADEFNINNDIIFKNGFEQN